MKSNRMLLLILLVTAAVLVSCSRKAVLPIEAQGVWTQSDDGSPGLKLKLENSDDGARAFYATGGAFGEGEEAWFGPLLLEDTGPGEWRFTIAPIVTTEGQNTNRSEPPQATAKQEYAIDQNNRMVVLSYVALTKSGDVLLRLDGDSLEAKGLWAQMKTVKVGEDGKPAEEKITPLTTKFIRSPVK
jgi:hypothetical protein